MADITLAGAADWSTCNGGGAPGASDNIYLNGFALSMDGANDSTYTCALIYAEDGASNPTNGTIVLDNATSTIVANLKAGTETLCAVAAKTLTVTGDITGGTGTADYGLNVSGASVVGVTGTVTGGSGTLDHGINQTAGTVTITGNVTGGDGTAAYGISFASGTLTVTGTVTGGSAVRADGVNVQAGTATIGTAKGGSHALAPGVNLQANGTVTVNATDLTGTGQPIGAGTLKLGRGARLKYQDENGVAKTMYGGEMMIPSPVSG